MISRAFLFAFVFVVFERSTGQSVDTMCLIAHCGSEISGCVQDTECSQALTCIQKCGANQSCDFQCLASFANSQFDTFMKCAVTVNHCIVLSPPTPTQCKKPTGTMPNIPLSKLQGKWFTVRGLNPASDCFQCDVSNFTIAPTTTSAAVTETYSVTTIGGGTKSMQTSISVEQTSPGVFMFSSVLDGLIRKDEYHVLDYSSNFGSSLLYYCANLAGMVFEGVKVYSREPSLSPDALNHTSTVAKSFGYDISSFCAPKTSGC